MAGSEHLDTHPGAGPDTAAGGENIGARPTVVLRSTVLGAGMPALCTPLVGGTVDDLRAEVAALPADVVDVVELRVDFLQDVGEDAVRAAIAAVRGTLADTIPILFTFRSRREGGQRDITPAAYEQLLRVAVTTGEIDAVDVEMFTEPATLGRIVADAHRAGVAVVMSSHDFGATPPRSEIIARLRAQQQAGADVVKIAVMPRDARDVLTLLDATVEYSSDPHARPAITMSMGSLGVVSRLAGETFGSCLTFGSVGVASAPGQVDAADLRRVLELLHTRR